MRRVTTVTTAALAAVWLSSVQAFAAPVYDGNGWQLDGLVNRLDKTPWSIQFYDTYSRDRLTYYMRKTAAELELHTGIDFHVEATINRTSASCPGYTSGGRHRIVVRLDPNTTRSSSTMCAVDGFGHSSRVLFSDYYWKNKLRSGSNGSYRKNVSSHELGHSVGLGHPDPSFLYGTDPLMAGDHWGGYGDWERAHKYTTYDINGLKQLVKNGSQ